MKTFYSHLVTLESLVVDLSNLELEEEEKVHLSHLIDGTIHHTILDEILSHLSEDEKRIFLQHLKEDDHDTIWKFLNSRIDNIEEKIKKVAEDLKAELQEDLKEAHTKKQGSI